MDGHSEDDIKPRVTHDDVISLSTTLYGLKVSAITELNAYDDRNFHLIVQSSENPYIKDVSPHGYVLKIINSLDSNRLPFFEAQNEIMLLLKEKRLPAPFPVKNLSGEYSSEVALSYRNNTRHHLVRVFEFQPGKILKSVPGSKNLYYQVGVWAARLDIALKTQHHPVLESHITMWHLKWTPNVKAYVSYVTDPKRRAMVADVIDQFSEVIFSKADELEKGIIHGDLNEQNILVNCGENGSWDISSILDFGDVNIAFYLFEVAAAMGYMMLEGLRNNLDYLECGGETLAGYQSVRALTRLEHSLLKLAICGRLCQSLVLGLYSQSLQPENLYIGDTQTHGWSVLEKLWNTPDENLAQVWPLAI